MSYIKNQETCVKYLIFMSWFVITHGSSSMRVNDFSSFSIKYARRAAVRFQPICKYIMFNSSVKNVQ